MNISPVKFGRWTTDKAAVMDAYRTVNQDYLAPLLKPANDDSLDARLVKALHKAGVDVSVKEQPAECAETNGSNILVVDIKDRKSKKRVSSTYHRVDSDNTPAMLRHRIIFKALLPSWDGRVRRSIATTLKQQGFDVKSRSEKVEPDWTRKITTVTERATGRKLQQSVLV